jgi:hypothetical protein
MFLDASALDNQGIFDKTQKLNRSESIMTPILSTIPLASKEQIRPEEVEEQIQPEEVRVEEQIQPEEVRVEEQIQPEEPIQPEEVRVEEPIQPEEPITSEISSIAPECRICFDKITAQCIAPCSCRGTAMFVCLPCYYKLVKSSRRCQSCRTEFPPCSVTPIVEYLWRVITLSTLGIWILVAVCIHLLLILSAYFAVTLMTTQHNVMAIVGSVSGVLIVQKFWKPITILCKTLISASDNSTWTLAVQAVETVASVVGIELVIQNGSASLDLQTFNEILNSNVQMHVFRQNQANVPVAPDVENETEEEETEETEEVSEETEEDYEAEEDSDQSDYSGSEESGYQEMLDAVLYEESNEEFPVVLLTAQ